MAYAVIEDLTGTIELAAFPTVFNRCSNKLIMDNKVIVSGKLNMREDQNNTVLVDDIVPPERTGSSGRLYLRLDMNDSAMVERIQTMLRRYPGNVTVILVDAATKKAMQADRGMSINPSPAFMAIMNEMLGEENVKLK